MKSRSSEVVGRKCRLGRFAASLLSATALPSVFLVPGAHGAQPQLPAEEQQVEQSETQDASPIVVTGTRIVRDGYEAPTPTTVLSVERLEQQASPSVIDYLTTVPAFSGNVTPQSSTEDVDSGKAGVSSVNLRNLGPTRTLVLMNGQRIVPSTVDGRVDVDLIPSQLIQRIDVVTGGASSVYGSDAVAGVVNFVLDTRFTGIAGEASGGITHYGDNENYRATLTAGTPFADGRGHVIVAGEARHQAGIHIVDRDWNRHGNVFMTNPAYGTGPGQSRDVPQRLLLENVGPAQASRGGMIVSGPLRGIAFGEGGVPYNFVYGDLVSGALMRGGEWREQNYNITDGKSLEPRSSVRNIFARASYEISDAFEVYGQWSWNYKRYWTRGYGFQDNGGIIVPVTNAFLDESIRAQALAAGLDSLEIGSSNQDMGFIFIDNERWTNRFVVGAQGDFQVVGTSWSWDAYYQHGISRNTERAINNRIEARYYDALDSVRDPETGAIVCRSTLANPNNGCVAYTPFGINVNSPTQLAYIRGDGLRKQRLTQDVVAASLQGEPFSTWAGPVSVATGVEHRREKASGSVSLLDQQRAFYAGNYQPTAGAYNVTEGFLEAVVPLARQAKFAESLELNAAVRATDYSNAGYVTTWKIGGTWSPVNDLTFRATRSRDIRAPNISELFDAGTSSLTVILDNGEFKQATAITRGNPSLAPEKADTIGVGVVIRPSFFPGFEAAVDYWDIDVKGIIAQIAPQQIFDFCAQGNAEMCAAINPGTANQGTLLPGSVANIINRQPFNLARQNARGIDFEMGYTRTLAEIFDRARGSLSVRALATHYIRNRFDTGVGVIRDTAGENNGAGPPSWRWQASASYDAKPLALALTARGVSAGAYNNDWIECQTGCPVSVTPRLTVNENDIDGAVYFDLAVSYTVFEAQQGRGNLEAFANIKNVFNKDPVIVGLSNVFLEDWYTNPSLYDAAGRTYRVGVRFRM